MLGSVVISLNALVILIGLAAPATAVCESPTYPAGSTSIWVPDPGCTSGSTYNTPPSQPPQRHCHCWSYCGYTCDIIAQPTTTTLPPRVCGTPSTTPGQTWVPNVECTDGTTYNTATRHCHCYAFCGYKCDLLPTTTTTTTTTIPPRVCGTPSITPEQTWVPDPECTQGTTYNTATRHCHCYAFCGYKCDLLPTTTTALPVTTTPPIVTTTPPAVTTTPPAVTTTPSVVTTTPPAVTTTPPAVTTTPPVVTTTPPAITTTPSAVTTTPPAVTTTPPAVTTTPPSVTTTPPAVTTTPPVVTTTPPAITTTLPVTTTLSVTSTT